MRVMTQSTHSFSNVVHIEIGDAIYLLSEDEVGRLMIRTNGNLLISPVADYQVEIDVLVESEESKE